MSVLRKPAAWLADYIYAGWRQLRGRLSRKTSIDFLAGSLAPVIIIPGVYERWQFMMPLIRELHGRGHPVHMVDALRSNRVPVIAAAQIVDAYVCEHDLRDAVIVAHSKGGLIGKHVMIFGAAADRVRSMVAIATPFGGSRYAYFVPVRTLRAFSSTDTTISLLNSEQEVNARITSVFAKFDPHIPGGSELVGARNVRIEGSGHFRVLAHPDARAEVLRAVTKTLD